MPPQLVRYTELSPDPFKDFWRDIFDQSESNTHIVQPQRATNQKSESQKAMSSRFIVGC